MSYYFPVQRRQTIVEYISRRGSASVTELAELCQVSPMTIRRDLDLLEREEILMRTHGGVVYLGDSRAHEETFDRKVSYQDQLKDRIAAYAVRHFVTNDAVLFMEGGTTVTRMVDHMVRGGFTGLTVVTNGLRTAYALQNLDSTNNVICTGGILRHVSSTFVGPQAEDCFREMHADVAFFSAVGFTLDEGFTDPNMLEREIKLIMRASAARTIILLDSTKFGKKSLLTVFTPSEVDVLITDRRAPAFLLEELRRQGVDVHVVS